MRADLAVAIAAVACDYELTMMPGMTLCDYELTNGAANRAQAWRDLA